MSHQIKRPLRKTTASRNYLEAQQQRQGELAQDVRQNPKLSIFEHKNWSFKEKIKLMIFLRQYQHLPVWNSERRSIHLYKHLSDFIRKTRTPEQCKNIHSLLKRKFSSLAQIVNAMQAELQHQQNYDRMSQKYQKEIERFETQNQLLDQKYQKQYFEAVRSKKAIEKQEKRLQENLLYKQQNSLKQSLEDLLKNEKVYVKEQQLEMDSLNARRLKIIRQCDFHFRQWLKCAKILQFKNNTWPDSGE